MFWSVWPGSGCCRTREVDNPLRKTANRVQILPRMYPFLKRGARLLFKASGRLSGCLPVLAALPGRKFGDSMSILGFPLQIPIIVISRGGKTVP